MDLQFRTHVVKWLMLQFYLFRMNIINHLTNSGICASRVNFAVLFISYEHY